MVQNLKKEKKKIHSDLWRGIFCLVFPEADWALTEK